MEYYIYYGIILEINKISEVTIMIKLPEKNSRKWIPVFIILFALTFISMIAVSLILDLKIGFNNISGFLLLSLFVSLAIGLGGFSGARAYFITALVFDILGIFYMMIVSIFRTAEGWSDLVSEVSYLFLLSSGIILGFIIQIAVILIKRNKSSKKPGV